MRDAIRAPERVTQTMTEPQTGGQVQPDEAERRKGREEETRAQLRVLWMDVFSLRETLEQLGGGPERGHARGHLGRGGVVHCFHGVIERADAGGEPEAGGRVGGVGGVVEDGGGGQGGVVDGGFDALRCGEACDAGAFGGGEGRGDADVGEEGLRGWLLFVLAVDDGFGGVDGGAAPEGDERVDVGVLRDGGRRLIQLRDWRVLFDGAEGTRVVGGSEEGFEVVHERGLGREGGACYDEGFGFRRRQGGEEVVGDDGGAVVEVAEVVRFPETEERRGGGIHGCGVGVGIAGGVGHERVGSHYCGCWDGLCRH